MLAVWLAALALAGCAGVRLVSDYDLVIDQGISDFSEQLNMHVKNMAELGGQPEGSYEANLRTYNALEAKLELLITRATIASGGKSCRLQNQLYSQLSHVLQTTPSPVLQPEAGTADSPADSAAASACNVRLLTLVAQQLSAIRTIHRSADTCRGISCLRPVSARDALAAANQSIMAVMVVETAKKKASVAP